MPSKKLFIRKRSINKVKSKARYSRKGNKTKHIKKRLTRRKSVTRKINGQRGGLAGTHLPIHPPKLNWGLVDQFGLLPEVNTRLYPNSFTPLWNSGTPYPDSL